MKLKSIVISIGCCASLVIGASAFGHQVIEEDGWTAAPLEQRSYIDGMEIIAHHFANTDRGGKMQMITIKDRRYLIQSAKNEVDGHIEKWGQIIDVTDPLNPTIVADKAWPGGFQIQVAFQESSGKWLAVVPMSPPENDVPITAIYDVSDPENPVELSRLITSSHRNYYDGGRYAYLHSGLGAGFGSTSEEHMFKSASGLKIADLSDPTKPRLISMIHAPGQRSDEASIREGMRSYENLRAMTSLHGPVYVPVRAEDGGKYAYSTWGALGFYIHDISNPEQPRLVSSWLPDDADVSGLPFHTVDIARLNRGFVIASPEPFMPQCQWPWQDTYILDVSDPTVETKELAKLPIPEPHVDAPYDTFCERYGRFGPHNPPHLKAPGQANPNFTCYAYFAAGLQCFDISEPTEPKVAAYFVPRQGDASQEWSATPDFFGPTIRTADNVFIEWDRRLIWLAADSGLYLLATRHLGKPVLEGMPVEEWVLPSINRGWQE